ncbi:hypothetical protein [Sphingobacterium sp. FBM7-1]|uniref:hypothetical protein n=1 Tax=Sphingobacterium sp. FBM7-1 TaxID=2886688 RepID=UPI001D11661E|nr:hypothetical protein [Sphingobacterium sp. FBM7-1]MCC2599944.1 hypothetical protein [Sphingobacterium sp. FBM7-1]
MEITTQSHPLRTITLRYDRTKPATDFETLALQYFQEMHDRTWEMKQRINGARLQITGFQIEVEELEALFENAKAKFNHLQKAYDTNPYKPTLRVQLKRILAELHTFMDRFVPQLVKLTEAYYAYDEYTFAQDKWLEEIAHPAFNKIFENYTDCSVDMGFFDTDLDDFRGVRSLVKKQEGKYYTEMDSLIDNYSDLNELIADFFNAVEEFDKELI